MGLVAPLFLLGALAIALPLWLHRLQTKSANRSRFGSAMLLETTEQRVHVEKKLKYLALLALRIAVIVLLALAFAKPFLMQDPVATTATGAGTQLIVLDTSVSMGRSGTFAQAQQAALNALNDAPADALVQTLTADGSLNVSAAASIDRSAHRQTVRDARPGTARLAFGPLVAQLERLAETLPAPVAVHFVSDFQASAAPNQFADLIAAGVAAFTPHVVGTGNPINVWIESVATAASGIGVTIAYQGDSERVVDVSLAVDGERVATESIVAAGRNDVQFDALEFAPGEHQVTITLAVDDDLSADNTWHGVVAIEPPRPVPIVTANPGGLPTTYLRAALESVVDAGFEVVPLTIGDFDARILTRYRWAIVDDLSSVTPLLAESLDEYISNGGNVLAFVGDASRTAATLPVSGHELSAADLSASAARYASLDQLDLLHPALADTSGWHRVGVTETVVIEPQADDAVLARLDDGRPFLLEQTRGEGRLLLMLSALDNRWNDLPVHPVFVGFVVESARYLSERVVTKRQYLTGDALPLSLIGSTAGQVVDPQGETLLSLADTASAQMIRLDKPGVYAVYTAEGQTQIAANLDARESDFSRMPNAALERWQALSVDAAPRTAAAGDDTATPLALWPWVLLLLAVFAIAEAALGNVHIAMTKRAPA